MTFMSLLRLVSSSDPPFSSSDVDDGVLGIEESERSV
jgi:hypothetical protein